MPRTVRLFVGEHLLRFLERRTRIDRVFHYRLLFSEQLDAVAHYGHSASVASGRFRIPGEASIDSQAGEDACPALSLVKK